MMMKLTAGKFFERMHLEGGSYRFNINIVFLLFEYKKKPNFPPLDGEGRVG